MTVSPSVLLTLLRAKPTRIVDYVSVDTETSGLFVDDNARISTVSVGWRDHDDVWKKLNKKHKLGLTIRDEQILPDFSISIVSVAWPFDQGLANTGKPEDYGQGTLLDEAENLPREEFEALLDFIELAGQQRPTCAHNTEYDTIVAWIQSVLEGTTTLRDIPMAIANSVRTNETAQSVLSKVSGVDYDANNESWMHMVVDALVAAKPTWPSSLSTMLMGAERRIVSKSKTAKPEAVETPRTAGSKKKASPQGSKSSVPIANSEKKLGMGSVHIRCHRCDAPYIGGLVFHHAKFDLHMLLHGVRRWPGLGRNFLHLTAWDTQNGNSLLYPLLKNPETFQVTTSLKPSCAVLFGQEFEDESKKVKAYLAKAKLPTGRWDLIPWIIVGPYADMDARLTIMLLYRQLTEILRGLAGQWLSESDDPEQKVADILAALNRRLDTTKLLFKMEERGLPYDEMTSREAGAEAMKRAAVLASQLPFRPTDVESKKYYFTDKVNDKKVKGLNLVPYSMTDKGNPQLTAEILTRMVNDNIPYAKELSEYNKVTNAASMWYNAYANAMGTDGRLRTNFRQNGTRSHRFSVERVNLQAIPQDYRLEGYPVLAGIPTPRDIIGIGASHYSGWRLWELDLAQAELRVAAMYAKCKRMLEMISNGEDLHDFTTKSLFDMDQSHEHWFQHRQIGKRGNFSLIFGAEWATFSGMVSKETGVILGEPMSRKIVRDWNGLYPEFKRAVDHHMSRVQMRQTRYKHGWVDLAYNERRWFEEYEDAHKAFNQRVQPNLAQFGIEWMLASEEILLDSGIQKQADEQNVGGVGLLLTIHDSQVILAPDNAEGKAAIDACANAGRELWARSFAVPGDVDVKPFRKAS